MVLNKIYVNDYSDAVTILKDPDLQNDRVSPSINFWREKFPIDSNVISSFFGQWLMYMDGDEHHKLRGRLLNILRMPHTIDYTDALSPFAVNPVGGCITDITCENSVKRYHRQFLGIGSRQQVEVLAFCEGILHYLFAPPNPSSIARVSKEITQALTWFDEQTFEPGKMLFLAKQEGIPAPLCLNLILDSYHPILFAAKSIVVRWAQLSRETCAISDAAFVRETLTTFPPFAYINRIRGENLLSINISNCHSATAGRAGFGLTFGLGGHACPGQALSVKYLIEMTARLNQLKREFSAEAFLKPHRESLGYTEHSDFRIVLSPQVN